MALSLVLAAASLVISGFSFICLLAYLRRRTGAKRILEDFEEEVNRLIASIDAAADRDITLLEDRSAAVKALLETLDRRIATYAREQDRRAKQESAYAALGRGLRSTLAVNQATSAEPDAPAAGAPAAGAPADDNPAGGHFADNGIANGNLADDSPGAVGGSATTPGLARVAGPVEPPQEETPPPSPTRPAGPSLAEQARELHRNGFSPETIAIRLDATLAEINLALALPDRPGPPP
jgi:hypothetical protein